MRNEQQYPFNTLCLTFTFILPRLLRYFLHVGKEDHTPRGFPDLLQRQRHRCVRSAGSDSVHEARTTAMSSRAGRGVPSQLHMLHGRLGIHELYM